MLDSFTEARIIKLINTAIGQNGFVSEADLRSWLIPYIPFPSDQILNRWIDSQVRELMKTMPEFRPIFLDGQRLWMMQKTSTGRRQ